MLLEDNMPQTANRSLFDQDIATRNKKLIAIISFYVLSYSCSKWINLFQMLNGYYLFAKHVPKHAIKSLYQMDIVILSETIWRVFQVNI